MRGRHVLAGLLLTAVALTGCSGGAGDTPLVDGGGDAEAAGAAEAPAAARDAGNADADTGVRGAPRNGTTAPRAPAVISTGTLTIESEDVGRARFDLGKVVDALDGQVADEKTTAGSDGEVRLSRLVLRIPSENFDQAMAELGRLGKVTASTRKAEDVTGEVIDTEARIRAQEQSLERVEVLFARAQNIRDIVAIEAQLSRRQAELDSLKGQLAWLEDQTTLATITVYLEQAPDEERTEKDDHNAFVSGLQAGWDALTGAGAALATVAGALLPFAVVGLVLGVPTWLLVRRWLPERPFRRPATADGGEE